MSAPDPEGFSLLAKLAGALAAIATPVYGVWKLVDRKADKSTVANSFQKVESELTLHRGYFKDVFNQMREAESKSEQRHRELLMHLIEKKDE